MKKLLAVLAAVTLLLALFPAGVVSAEILIEGDYEYTFDESGVTITKYTGSGGDVVIPDTLGGYPVVGIYGDYSAEGNCKGAFANCTNLISITIPVSIAEINDGAFCNCRALTDVYYGGSKFDREQISIGDEARYYLFRAAWHYTCPSDDPSDPICFEYEVSNGEATIVAYTGIGGDVVIPDTLGGYPVVEIGWYPVYDDYSGAFEFCTGLTSVTIPDSVTTIDRGAFRYCAGLTSVTITDSVTTIGEEAFSNCTGLTSVTIPDSVISIGSCAFRYCTGLTSVTIPDSVISIGSCAFRYCTGLTSVIIPESVIGISTYAFDGCTNLTDVWYSGAKIDRALMVIEADNTTLVSANWHYEVVAENGHYYNGACDTDCDKCGEVRQVPHGYSDCCDRECNVCFAIRKPPHNYAYVCDDECDTCGFLRKVTHTYDNDYDLDCNVCGEVRTIQYEVYAFAGNSVSPEVSGLAFRFDMAADSLSANARNEVIYGDATVTSNSDVGALKLVKMGVIVSNTDIELKLENVNDYTCVDVETQYLMDWEDDFATFAVRIINIPEIGYDTIVYARPYCIYEDVDGTLIVEYGEVQTATYNGASAA